MAHGTEELIGGFGNLAKAKVCAMQASVERPFTAYVVGPRSAAHPSGKTLAKFFKGQLIN
jgi:hypothetical protein